MRYDWCYIDFIGYEEDWFGLADQSIGKIQSDNRIWLFVLDRYAEIITIGIYIILKFLQRGLGNWEHFF